jgi:hypothetical protein
MNGGGHFKLTNEFVSFFSLDSFLNLIVLSDSHDLITRKEDLYCSIEVLPPNASRFSLGGEGWNREICGPKSFLARMWSVQRFACIFLRLSRTHAFPQLKEQKLPVRVITPLLSTQGRWTGTE